MRGAVTGHSRADGEVHMVGPLRRPRELQFTANLDNLDADVEDVKIKNQGPIRFSVANQILQIDQFHLVGQDTDISANGKVHLTGDRELDLRAQGRVNLKLIESFNPDFTSSGVVWVDRQWQDRLPSRLCRAGYRWPVAPLPILICPAR